MKANSPKRLFVLFIAAAFLPHEKRAAGYEDMRRRVPDPSKLERVTGFRPGIPLDETLREVIAYESRRQGVEQSRARDLSTARPLDL